MKHEQQDLLDLFAGQAMPAVIEAQVAAMKGQVNPFQIGMMCYAIALGMLAAREQPEEAFAPREKEPEIIQPEGPKLVVP